jgi:hypothetical protein
MQSRALAQGSAQEAPGVPAGTLRVPPEQLGLGVGGQRGQPKQVSYFDPLQRTIRASGHAPILSRPTPIHPLPQRPYTTDRCPVRQQVRHFVLWMKDLWYKPQRCSANALRSTPNWPGSSSGP